MLQISSYFMRLLLWMKFVLLSTQTQTFLIYDILIFPLVDFNWIYVCFLSFFSSIVWFSSCLEFFLTLNIQCLIASTTKYCFYKFQFLFLVCFLLPHFISTKVKCLFFCQANRREISFIYQLFVWMWMWKKFKFPLEDVVLRLIDHQNLSHWADVSENILLSFIWV